MFWSRGEGGLQGILDLCAQGGEGAPLGHHHLSFIMKHLFMTLVSTLGLLSSTTGEEAIPLLAPKAFQAAFQADSTAVILDVRRPSEFAEGHLKGAILLDWLSDKAFVEGLAKLDKSRTHYVYCRSGHRSKQAATLLSRRGIQVYELSTGWLGWVEAALPTAR